MNFRITTNTMMNTYRYNLQNATRTRDLSSTKVQTRRNFNSFAEDPAAATHAWRLRRSYSKNVDYQNSNTEAYTRFQIAYATLETSNDKLLNGDAGAFAAIKHADNEPTGGARTNLGTVLSELADSLVYNLNAAKYGDHFVFSGNDEMNVPFSWSEDGTKLLYRGVNVSAGGVQVPEPNWASPKVPANMPQAGAAGNTANDEAWIAYYTDQVNNPKPNTDEPEWGEMVPQNPPAVPDPPVTDADKANKVWVDYYNAVAKGEEAERPTAPAGEPAWAAGERDKYGVPTSFPNPPTEEDKKWIEYYKDQGEYNHLQEMADEKVYMDLGMGMKETTVRDLVNASAFNRVIPGIGALGYGVDEDGDPKNIAVIMKRLSKLYSQCNDNGDFCDEEGKLSTEVEKEVYRLLNKFGIAHDQYNKVYADVSARSEFLVANGASLKDQGISLNEQIVDIENVDPAMAIQQFMYDYSCYNAALKVGTQILSQSLIDYMS